ncbi:MAG: efflux RND transporter periplasmic adaptor subunit [Steroidobacterales bacterium]
MFGRMVWVLSIAGTVVGCSAPKAPAPPQAAAPVAAIVVQAERVPVERRLDGVIEAVNQGTVAAQTAGRVESIFYDVNDFVPAGAVIVRLRSTEQHASLAQAQAALSEATARAGEAQTRYQRIAELYQSKVVPKATFDEASANRDAAVARLGAARAGIASATEGVAYTEIRAPYAGIITKRLVQVGESVSPGTPLISGLSLQFLRVTVDVPQSIVDQVRRLKKAAVYIGDRRIEATKVTIFPEASSPSNTFRARLELPENATDLYPGMFVKAGFVTGEAERLLVPATAIVRRSEVTAVYVVDSSGRISMRQVRLGDRFDDREDIISGLVAGDRVALDPLAAMDQLRGVAERSRPKS